MATVTKSLSMESKEGKEKEKETETEKEVKPLAVGMTAIKPEGWDMTGMEAFKCMLYNPKGGEILTRTPLSWLKIIAFYIIYYSFLTGFWVACLFIFFQTLPAIEEGPKWQNVGSIIKNNPGLGIRPRQTDNNIDSSMFVLREGDNNTHHSEPHGEGDLNADYAERTREFLEIYEEEYVLNNSMGFNRLGKPYEIFDSKTQLGDCAIPPYGYVGEKVTPCIYLKLNTIWGWFPKAINCSNNPKCPKSLTDHLGSDAGQTAAGGNVWVDCKGRNAADKEALSGGMEYFPPSRAIPIKYFPYEGRFNGLYHSPLVAVRITPKVIGQLIHIECRAYYHEVNHSTKQRLGLVQFEVIVRK